MHLAFNVMPPEAWNIQHLPRFKSDLHASDLVESRKAVEVRVIEVHLPEKKIYVRSCKEHGL